MTLGDVMFTTHYTQSSHTSTERVIPMWRGANQDRSQSRIIHMHDYHFNTIFWEMGELVYKAS
jgi:hypothetical protein